MRRAILAVLVLALVIGITYTVSQSSKTVKDAEWWNGMNSSSKVDYIAGFWNGVTWSDVVIKDALADFKKRGEISQQVYDDIFNKWLDYTEIGSTTVGDIVNRIDSFYDNPLNQKLTIDETMDIIVFNIQGLTMTDPTIQNLLKSYRDNH
jgi:hypothetical protein